MKKIALFFISLLLGGFLFTWVVGKTGWEDVWMVIVTFSFLKLFVIAALTIIMIGVGVFKWKQVLKGQGYSEVSFYNLWNPYFASFALSFFAPMLFFGGEVLRAYSLRDSRDIPFTKGMASVVIDRILELGVYLVIIIIGVIFFLFNSGAPPSFLLWILAGAVLFSGLFIFIFMKEKSIIKIFLPKGDNNGLADIEQEVLDFFHFSNPFLFKSILLSFAKSGVALLRAWVLIFFFGEVISILPLIGVVGFHYAALFAPIPAALGLHDAFQIFAFSSIGFGGSMGAGFALIIRVAEFIVATIAIISLVRIGLGMIISMIIRRATRFIQG